MKKWISLLISLVLFVPGTLIARAVEIATVQSVKVSPDSVRIRTDQPVNYNAFTTSVPPRLIIDLIDSRIKSPENFPGMGKLLKRVRTGQYRIKPMSISRIVLDLTRKAAYDIIAQGNEINVNLLTNATATDLKDAPAVSTSTASKPATVTLAKKIIPVKKTKKVRKPKTRDIMNSLPKDLISIDYVGQDIRDVLGWCAVKMGVNIICGDVVGQITIRLNKVPFDEAFRTILNLNGLATEQVGNNILRIATPEVLRATRQQAMKVTKIFTLNYTPAAEMQSKITSIVAAEGSKAVCTVDSANNLLIITETPSGLESIARLIKQLDRKPQQVLIETKFVEIALSEGLDLGINWSMYTSDTGKIAGQSGLNFFGMANSDDTFSIYGQDVMKPHPPGTGGTGVSLSASTIYGAFRLGRLTNNYLFDAILSAAAKKTKVKVLSDPKVATLNNKEATIDITTQIPYETTDCTQAATPICTTKVTYLTVGITLKVTPTINADGRVTLKIQPKVSQPSVTIAATSGGAPGIDSRSADTTVMVRDGETIVIGGLIHDTVTEGIYKIPLFGDIPLLGWLFKKKHTSRERMELLIFVTPRIMEG